MKPQLNDSTPEAVYEKYDQLLERYAALDEEQQRIREAISALVAPYIVYGLRDVQQECYVAKGTFDECFAKGMELARERFGVLNVRRNDVQIWHVPSLLGDRVDYRVTPLNEGEYE